MLVLSMLAWGGSASLGKLGRLGEGWGMLGEYLGEAWGGMLGNALGRLGEGWGRLGESLGNVALDVCREAQRGTERPREAYV